MPPKKINLHCFLPFLLKPSVFGPLYYQLCRFNYQQNQELNLNRCFNHLSQQTEKAFTAFENGKTTKGLIHLRLDQYVIAIYYPLDVSAMNDKYPILSSVSKMWRSIHFLVYLRIVLKN